jgi:hypothetical protein
MDKLKDSLLLGLILGIISSLIMLIILDLSIYILRPLMAHKILDIDVVFAISTLASLVISRIFIKKSEKHELAKGFLFAAFVWGAIYVFLFHIKHFTHLFFVS